VAPALRIRSRTALAHLNLSELEKRAIANPGVVNAKQENRFDRVVYSHIQPHASSTAPSSSTT
jgi:hypothetical protein